jgi:hypothetical protein
MNEKLSPTAAPNALFCQKPVQVSCLLSYPFTHSGLLVPPACAHGQKIAENGKETCSGEWFAGEPYSA